MAVEVEARFSTHLLILMLLVSISCVNVSGRNPIHASCEIDWKFGLSCSQVSSRIINQIEEWKGDDCGSGEKCLYKFVSFDNKVLKATHTTPVQNYVDDLTFEFTTGASDSDCNVHGTSSSETWYAVFDYGTNYCNLHNLITGAKLDKVSSYSEETDNRRCTQYSTADCEKY